MAKGPQMYECRNQACTLGTRETPGRFTNGLSEDGKAVLGLPPDAPTGHGVCPNCGSKGVKV